MPDWPATPTITVDEAAELEAQLEGAETTIEFLRESLADVELMLEDRGWQRLGTWADHQFSRDGLRRAAKLARTMAIVNPLIRRGLNLRAAYVWGGGVQIAARATGSSEDNDAEQDVNAVVQAFLDDRGNKKVLTGGQARETNERTLGTDGSLLFACFTNPRTGRVQVRDLPYDEIEEVVYNPEDGTEVWFYKRCWTTPDQQTHTAYYPDIDYQPRSRVLRVNDHATVDAGTIRWDAPVIHVAVNGLKGWDFGIGDAFAAIQWARGYKDFLEDWAKLVKALSRFAWRATSDRKSKAQNAAAQARKAPAATTPGGSPDQVGAFASMGPGQTLEAIPKTGATIDAGSGRPLAAMVAAGLDVPVTMLLADPGVTGARATAETLDRPTEDMARMRREVWTDFHHRLLDYVVDAAVKAPSGPLAGTVGRDEWGREVITLAGDTERTIEIDWSDLTETPISVLMTALLQADEMEVLPDLTLLKLVLQALGVKDADEIISEATDEDGNFVPPTTSSGTSAGDVAVRAARRGEDPAGAL